ncbi:MAG: hypothetical protein V1724_08330 [Chloroflexota bacterium]
MHYERTHYDVLGLGETASTKEVSRAFLNMSRPGAPVGEVAARRCEEAYSVLADPVRRAVYDGEMGYSKEFLAKRIGHSGAGWGMTWAVLFGFLAVFFLLDHENMSRMIGSNFAPGFYEVQEYIDEEICKDDGQTCAQGYFRGKFFSTNASWEWLLNSWLALSLGPALVTGAVALGGREVLNRTAGRIIASVRSEGHTDTWVRAGLFLVAALAPVAVVIYVALYGLGGLTPYECESFSPPPC